MMNSARYMAANVCSVLSDKLCAAEKYGQRRERETHSGCPKCPLQSPETSGFPSKHSLSQLFQRRLRQLSRLSNN